MKKQVSQKTYIATIFVMLCVVVLLLGCLFFILHGKEQVAEGYEVISMQYGEYMQGFNVKNIDGEMMEGLPQGEKTRVVVYLSSTCHGCVDIVQNYQKISSIFESDGLEFVLLWNDGVPKKLVEEYQVDKSSCYELIDTRFATTTPTYYIINQDMKIDFVTSDATILVEKIIDLENVEKARFANNANKYITNTFFEDSGRNKLVYFAMEGCPDCEAVEPLIESAQIKTQYDVVKIYKYDDMDASHIKDDYKIYKEVFDIKWYPSFLLYQGDEVEFIGEMSVDEIEKKLLK